MRVALIDADTLLWVACYYGKDTGVEKMLSELDSFITGMLTFIKADKYIGFLQGEEKSFRRTMFPNYKANRPPVPEWITELRPIVQKHLLDKWKFHLTINGFESDDAVASVDAILKSADYLQRVQTDSSVDPIVAIICSADKDMKQIPGWNYNTRKGDLTYVSEGEARDTLALQLLTGDVADNIKPVRKGFGPVTAKKALSASDDSDMYAVHKIFMDELGIIEGSLRFAENVLKVVLKRDLTYPFTLYDIPVADTASLFMAGNTGTSNIDIHNLFNTSNAADSSG